MHADLCSNKFPNSIVPKIDHFLRAEIALPLSPCNYPVSMCSIHFTTPYVTFMCCYKLPKEIKNKKQNKNNNNKKQTKLIGIQMYQLL